MLDQGQLGAVRRQELPVQPALALPLNLVFKLTAFVDRDIGNHDPCLFRPPVADGLQTINHHLDVNTTSENKPMEVAA